MTKSKNPRIGQEAPRASNAEKSTEARVRAERLKSALKANIARRKAQTKARQPGPGDTKAE